MNLIYYMTTSIVDTLENIALKLFREYCNVKSKDFFLTAIFRDHNAAGMCKVLTKEAFDY